MTSRTIGVLAFHDVLTSELAGPVEVLRCAIARRDLRDTTLLVVAAGDRDVRTHEGLVVAADTTIHECPDLDVLVVPGAADMSSVLDDAATVDFVARQGRTADTVATHCAGAFLAGAAGLLDGRRVTTYAGGHADLTAAAPDAIVVESDVVVDGTLVSSGAGTLSYLGALQLLRELTDADVARHVATELSLDRLAAQMAEILSDSTHHDRAGTPEDVTRLFVERSNAGDADGVAALYAEDAVLAYPPGEVTVGRAAIREMWAAVLAHAPTFTAEESLPTLIRGDVALAATAPRDGAGARAQVLRRGPDGSWVRIIDRPEFVQQKSLL